MDRLVIDNLHGIVEDKRMLDSIEIGGQGPNESKQQEQPARLVANDRGHEVIVLE